MDFCSFVLLHHPALLSQRHSNPIAVRRKHQQLPSSLLIENASTWFLPLMAAFCPSSHFRSRLTTMRPSGTQSAKTRRVTPVEFVAHSPGESMVLEIAAVMSTVHLWVCSTSRTKKRGCGRCADALIAENEGLTDYVQRYAPVSSTGVFPNVTLLGEPPTRDFIIYRKNPGTFL